MNLRSLALALVWLAAPLSARADLAEADAAFRAGDFARAIEVCAEDRSADAAAFRARVLLAEAISGEADPPRALLDRALAAADLALAEEPAHVEGRLQRAIALSLIVRPMSIGEARRLGHAETSRALAEAVLADDPANPWAHAFLSVWHVEVQRRGGAIGAAVMGASLREARRHYEAASRAAPQDVAIRWQWARALAALDARRHTGEIETALAAALAIPPETKVDAVMQARAVRLQQLLSEARPRAVQDFAAATL
jgi:tetratricopeptide (TPR) repeat protein